MWDVPADHAVLHAFGESWIDVGTDDFQNCLQGGSAVGRKLGEVLGDRDGFALHVTDANQRRSSGQDSNFLGVQSLRRE